MFEDADGMAWHGMVWVLKYILYRVNALFNTTVVLNSKCTTTSTSSCLLCEAWGYSIYHGVCVVGVNRLSKA